MLTSILVTIIVVTKIESVGKDLNFRVYILAIAAFVVGTVELIIGGTLDLVANDLGVSISAAGQLITIFSVVFALSGPVLLALTGKFERKTLYVGALSIFLIGNIISAFSVNYGMLMFSRVICAASGSLIIALSVTLASSVVAPQFRARAIGIIFMGISIARTWSTAWTCTRKCIRMACTICTHFDFNSYGNRLYFIILNESTTDIRIINKRANCYIKR